MCCTRATRRSPAELHRGAEARASGTSSPGSVTETSSPPPRFALAATVPSWLLAIAWTIESPARRRRVDSDPLAAGERLEQPRDQLGSSIGPVLLIVELRRCRCAGASGARSSRRRRCGAPRCRRGCRRGARSGPGRRGSRRAPATTSTRRSRDLISGAAASRASSDAGPRSTGVRDSRRNLGGGQRQQRVDRRRSPDRRSGSRARPSSAAAR